MGINVRVLLRTSRLGASSAASWRLSAHDGHQRPCCDLADLVQALLQTWKDWLQSLCLGLADLTPTFDTTCLQSWASTCQSPCFESADLVPDQRQSEKRQLRRYVTGRQRSLALAEKAVSDALTSARLTGRLFWGGAFLHSTRLYLLCRKHTVRDFDMMRLLAFTLALGAAVASVPQEEDCADEPDNMSRLSEVSLLQSHTVTHATTFGQHGLGRNAVEAATGGLGLPVAITVAAAIALFVLDKTYESEYSAIFAEFLGTFALVFTVACCVATGSAVWNATAIACVLMVMVYGTGPVSGGHLNPAVTLALAWSEKFPWEKVPVYCATQITAALSAA
eukprot:s2767_g1.t1